MKATIEAPLMRETAGTAAPERNAARDALRMRNPMANEDDRPATKGDLNNLRDDLRTEMHSGLAGLRTEMHDSMDRLRDELVDKMRDMQTEVLRAFHGWASPIEIRLRSLPNIEERLGLLEERVGTIERRDKLN